MNRENGTAPPAAAICSRISACRRALCASASASGGGTGMGIPVRQRNRIRNAAIAWERLPGRRWLGYRLFRQPRAATAASTDPDRGPAPSCAAMDAPHRPVALVTGAARRLGAATARGLHAAGYDLALHYRSSAAPMQALADALETERPGSVLVLQADLAQFDRLPELVAKTVGRFGRLDALVNNASGFGPTPLGTVTPAQWDILFASNARAPFFLAQAAAPHLAAAQGAIVNMTDIHARRPLRDHAVYCMAKAALEMATRSLALELGPHVRVNAIAPGA